jgi:hypothetical protein
MIHLGTPGILSIFGHSAEFPTIWTNLRKADIFCLREMLKGIAEYLQLVAVGIYT